MRKRKTLFAIALVTYTAWTKAGYGRFARAVGASIVLLALGGVRWLLG
jgi:hypothetical protein